MRGCQVVDLRLFMQTPIKHSSYAYDVEYLNFLTILFGKLKSRKAEKKYNENEIFKRQGQ